MQGYSQSLWITLYKTFEKGIYPLDFIDFYFAKIALMKEAPIFVGGIKIHRGDFAQNKPFYNLAKNAIFHPFLTLNQKRDYGGL
ncbi:hypothetical protein [Haemophilus paracuniculus]|uniref:hypothetical protein n=1 Tax=Haemophilus paracuniculus TaxID=734 RepID=UPI001301696A|nr:hypothetical protein [Haemophilus paracuniculus]